MLCKFLKDRLWCRLVILPIIFLSVLGFTAPQKLTGSMSLLPPCLSGLGLESPHRIDSALF